MNITRIQPRRFVVGISGASGACYALRCLELLLGQGHEVHLVVTDYGRRLLFDEAGIRTLDVESLVPALVRSTDDRPKARAIAGTPGLRSAEGPGRARRSVQPLWNSDESTPRKSRNGTARGRSSKDGGPGTGVGVSSHAVERGKAAVDLRDRLIVHPNKDVGAVIASGSFLHDGMVVLPCTSASLGQMATGSGSNLLCRAAMVTLKERRPLIVCHREMPLNLIDLRNMAALAEAGATICSPNPGFYLLPKTVEEIVDFVVGKVLDLLKVEHGLKIRWSGLASKG